jgi:hypothetical protein
MRGLAVAGVFFGETGTVALFEGKLGGGALVGW